MTKEYYSIRLSKRPEPNIPLSQCFQIQKERLNSVPHQSILIRVVMTSVDPAMLGWMKDVKSYIEPVKIGDVMRSYGIGIVEQSTSSKWVKGDFVTGYFGWQEYYVASGNDASLRKAKLTKNVRLETYMTVLNHIGLTAHHGLYIVGKPKPGDTIVVSAASGAVGSLVCQLAKRVTGTRVVGIAGSDEKCKWLTEKVGVDAAINYKKGSLYKNLKEACPKGIDIYFDNVGGEMLDTVLLQINRFSRIIICGAISSYRSDALVGPKYYLQLLVKSARMEGFVVFHYADKDKDALEDLAHLIETKKLISEATIIQGGITKCPEALMGLFTGQNLGKMMVKLSDIEERSRL